MTTPDDGWAPAPAPPSWAQQGEWTPADAPPWASKSATPAPSSPPYHRQRLPMAKIDTDGDTPPVDAPGFEDEAPGADTAPYDPNKQGMGRALVNAANQGMIQTAGAEVQGVGQITQQLRNADAARKLDIINRIQSGQGMPMPPMGSTGNEPEFADQAAYAAMTPEQLQQQKAGLEAALKEPAPGQETGQSIIDSAAKNFPVAPGNEGTATRFARGVGSAPIVLGSALVGDAVAGPAGAAVLASVSTLPAHYNDVYQDAVHKGATPDQADQAATNSAGANLVTNLAGMGVVTRFVPQPIVQGLTKTLVNLGIAGVTFGTTGALAKFADNYIAKNSYDPDRPYTQGVGDAAAENAVLGAVVPAAMAGARALGAAVKGILPAPTPEFTAAQNTLKQIAAGPAGMPPPESGPSAEPPAASPAQPKPPAPPSSPAAPSAPDEFLSAVNAVRTNTPANYFPKKAAPEPQSDVAIAQAPTTPAPPKPEQPTPAQAAAGNYAEVHTKVGGLDLAIETGAGQTRSGVAPDGTPWSVQMPADYGYVKRTEGADGDPVDVFLKPGSKATAPMKPVFVVDQIDPATGQFDEHKAMLGYDTSEQALADYHASFSDGSGPSRVGAVAAMPFHDFKTWAKKGDTAEPIVFAAGAKPVAQTAAPATAGQGANQVQPPFPKTRPPEAPAKPLANQPLIAPVTQFEREQAQSIQPAPPPVSVSAASNEAGKIDIAHQQPVTPPPISSADIKAGTPSKPKSAQQALADFKRSLTGWSFQPAEDIAATADSAQPRIAELPKAVQQEAQAYLDKMRAAAQPPSAPPNTDSAGRTMIGTNLQGRPIWQDPNGVRSIMDNGIRQTEPVQMRPTEQGVQPVVDSASRPTDFKTTQELAQEGNNGVRKLDSGVAPQQRPEGIQPDSQSGPVADVGTSPIEGSARPISGDTGASTGREKPGRKPKSKRGEVSAGNSSGEPDRLPDASAPAGEEAPRAEAAHAAVADVIEFGRRTGNEKLIFLDAATGATLQESEGRNDFVPFTDDMKSALADIGNNIVAIHNHPGGRALSLDDLLGLFTGGMAAVIAAGHNGTRYGATLPRRLDPFDPKGQKQRVAAFSALYKAMTDRVQSSFSDIVRANRATPEEFSASLHDAVCRLLDTAGEINYLSSYEQPPAFQAVLGKIAAATVGRKSNGWDARLATVVGPDSAVDQSFANAQSTAQGQPRQVGEPEYVAPSDIAPKGKPTARGHLAQPGDLSERNKLLASAASRAPPAFKPDPTITQGMRELPGPFGEEVRGTFKAIRDRTYNSYREVADALFPMRAGSTIAQKAAFDFANALRGITYRYGNLDSMLAARYSPAQRTAMGRALDAQSVFEQQLRENLKQLPETEREAHRIDARSAFDEGRTGLAGLPPEQRRRVELLNELSRLTWDRMVERGIVKPDAEGLPYYMPRQFVSMIGEKAGRLGPKEGGAGEKGAPGPSVNGFHQFGRNLNASGPKRRAYLTPEESLEAAKAKFGDNTELVTDIRALLVALSKNERSIAGRDLVDAIKAYGEAANEQWVVEGGNPDPRQYFTLADHPSLWKWRIRFKQDEEGKVVPEKTEDGANVFDRVPIHISKDFQGPLAAVLTQKSPSWYKGLMSLKSVGMHLIMFSPFMHLAVEIGRALPALPGKVLTGRVFVDGHRGLADDAFMNRAIADGLAPIAQRWSQDPASIADDNLNPYGHSKLARAVGGAKDAVARGIERFAGKFAGSVVRDPHQALLWRNVLKLQVGIYKNARAEFMGKGFPEDAAGIMAAHVGNRYAGALPPEHLHRFANMLANLIFFSRSFTLGNLGVMKDVFRGAPPHVLAAIQNSMGDVHAAKKVLARKARAAVLLDVGLFLIGTAIMQTAFQIKHDAASMGFTGAAAHAYEQWQHHAQVSLRKVTEGDPLAIAGLLPQHWNEPGKQDRAYLGNDESGRGEYARMMTGKVGEEMLGWISKPGTMLTNKENPLLSGLLDVIRNEDGLGRPVMPPNPQTFGDYLRDAGAIAQHLVGSQLPTGTIRDLAHGDWENIAGQVAGVVSLSRGFPGGPAAGVEYAAKKRDLAFEAEIMPAVRDRLQAGDEAGAIDLIEKSPMSQYGKMQMVKSLRYSHRPTRNHRSDPEEFDAVTNTSP